MSQQKTFDVVSCHLPLQKIEDDPQTFKGSAVVQTVPNLFAKLASKE